MDLLASLGIAVRLVVPIFVAMDPVGALPLVLGWTGHLNAAERDRQLRDALVTALALGLVFVLAGRWLLGVLGVDIPDFLVAGGPRPPGPGYQRSGRRRQSRGPR